MDHSQHDHLTSTVNGSATSALANATSVLLTTAASMLAAVVPSTESSKVNPQMHEPIHHHDHHDESMDMSDNKTMGMQMWFYVSDSAIILFREWDVESVGGMIGSVIGIILLSILYEGLKFFREYLFRQNYSRLSYSTCAVTGESPGAGAELHRIAKNRLISAPHLIQTGLHMVQIVLSYFLMLIFMTYNVWLCLGVVIGSGFGYFFFGWKKSTVVDISDHCH